MMQHPSRSPAKRGGDPRTHSGRLAPRLVPWLLLAALLLVPIPAARAQTTFTPITSYRVTGAPNYTDPGGESFWSSIPWTDVPLTATVAPGGGHTLEVQVKSANTGFDVYVLFQWNDSAGPSYESQPEMYRAANGTLLPLPPNPTGNITQLFYNSSYYYPDRVAMLWFIADTSQRAPAPAMQLGTDGAITDGAAEIWHWQSNPTDSNPLDTGFPGGYTDPAGNPIYPADNLSFAEDDYTNMSGFSVIPGSFGAGAPNLDPYADPFQVHAGNAFDNATKQWTVEMVRTFTTAGAAAAYQAQLQTGSSYFVAFAVWNGRMGESAEFKSVSAWYNLTISGTPASPPAAPTGGVSPELAAVVAVGTLIIGLAVGLVLRAKPEGSLPLKTGEETSENVRPQDAGPPPGGPHGRG